MLTTKNGDFFFNFNESLLPLIKVGFHKKELCDSDLWFFFIDFNDVTVKFIGTSTRPPPPQYRLKPRSGVRIALPDGIVSCILPEVRDDPPPPRRVIESSSRIR